LAVVAAVVIVVGLLPGNAAPASDAERARAIAANLRCPFCSGESIADAPAEVARDLQLFIAEKVAEGWSDDEIYAYFVARYTERVRLDSRFQGWGAALWLTPVALAGVGVAAVLQRRRRPADVTPAEPVAEAVGTEVELT
jgi:cytochrome c-type biogenesis protein CcmH